VRLGPRLRDGFHQILAHRKGASGADSAVDEGGVGVGLASGVVHAGGTSTTMTCTNDGGALVASTCSRVISLAIWDLTASGTVPTA